MNETCNKYFANMEKIYEIETKKAIKFCGMNITNLYDCFLHLDKNDNIVVDIECRCGNMYFHKWNVSLDKIKFE